MVGIFVVAIFSGGVSYFFEKFCCPELKGTGSGAEASCGLRERFGGIRKFIIIFRIICCKFF